jgi:hypothetical protein
MPSLLVCIQNSYKNMEFFFVIGDFCYSFVNCLMFLGQHSLWFLVQMGMLFDKFRLNLYAIPSFITTYQVISHLLMT